MSGKQIDCYGFMIHIFVSLDEHIMIDMFTDAVGYELLNNVLTEAEKFAEDYINMEKNSADFLMNTIDMWNKLLFDPLHVPVFVLYYI